MIYFLINGNPVFVDNNTTISYTPQIRRMKFGDGYEQSIPLAPNLISFTATFSNRTLQEIEIIEDYLTSLQGQVIPDFYIFNEVTPIYCTKFSKDYVNGGVFSLSAEFRQEFR
jgi:phage-related protein